MIKIIIAIIMSAYILSLTFLSSEAEAQAPARMTGQTSIDQIIPSTPEELQMAPLLDLHNGGQAVGAAQGVGPTLGSLVNGSLLPKAGDSFIASSSDKSRWGTGLMVSLIENSAPVIAREYPGNLVYVGAIAQEHGGVYAPHKSHQNGLDADILFMGTKNYDSVLDKDGLVTSRFETEKNWYYWRLITSQQIKVANVQGSVVSMILVDPRIKTYLCNWAKQRESTLDALDKEVLARLRPTEGHEDHFHVRLKCSPFYADCITKGDGYSPKKTGCAEFDPAP